MEGRQDEVNNNVKGRVEVVVKDPEDWLCVSRLPADVSEDEFYDILSEFGGVEESFLLTSSQSGTDKRTNKQQQYRQLIKLGV